MRIVLYVLMIVLFFAGSAAIFEIGKGLRLPEPKVSSDTEFLGGSLGRDLQFHGIVRKNIEHPLAKLLIQILVIFPAAFVMGRLFRRFGQPAVVGEIIAGICLGPSVLGFAWPAAYQTVFPPHSLTTLRLMGHIGVLIFMFMVGMEFNTALFKRRAHSALLISHASIVVPFFLGLLASLVLYTRYASHEVTFTVFSLFMGIAMSVTAFPVLARITQEKNLANTPLGTMALAAAAVDDVTAWTVFAFIVAGANSGSIFNAFITVAALICFGAVLFLITRRFGAGIFQRFGKEPSANTLFIALMVLFISAFFTEAIGIHAVFGAFLAGLVMPPSTRWRQFMATRLEFLSSSFLLPFFFAVVGIRTNISLLNGWSDWANCFLILAIAIIGKVGASSAVAKFEGMDWRNALSMGALMNTRGLMELIVLNVAYEMGIFSQQIFAMLVFMAIVTTMMTGPLLNMIASTKRHNSVARS